MTTQERVEFARRWYALGVCPGCGAELVKVAGQGERHYLAGQTVATASQSSPRITTAGELIRSGGNLLSGDLRLCRWSADALAALVHVGSGLAAS